MRALRKLAPRPGNVDYVDVPAPRCIGEHVVLKIAAAGICGTDLHIYDGEYPTRPPVTMGHEVAGTVFEVGAGVKGWQVGDRVTSETYFSVCGSCRYCRAGRSNLCPERRSIGAAVDGGFAPLLLVPARNLHRLPENVSLTAGALTEPLACCVHAMRRTTLDVGDHVLVSGPGPIGLLCAQLLASSGAFVVVAGTDADELRLNAAVELGAHAAVNVQTHPEALREDVDRFTGGLEFDVAVECAGAPGSVTNCLAALQKGGCYVQVGLFGKPVSVDFDALCLGEFTVSGTFAQVPDAWETAIRLMTSGRVKVDALISEIVPLREWARAFERLRQKAALKIWRCSRRRTCPMMA
jgi:L-iditol 2-dehydrogenase